MKPTFNENDLNNLKERLEKLERMRKDFVANVSHELRTPLTVLHGYLETLLSQDDKNLLPYEDIFKQMQQHSLRMEHIINDLLLLSRIENEEMTSPSDETIEVKSLLEEICDDARRISGDKAHAIQLEADTSLCIKGSKEELKSLFSNLIINAVKYTPENGKIRVEWFENDNKAIFSVSDTGIGIEKEHIPRITERFYRVDKARSRNSGGTGLGLAIAKHVLMRHHGQLMIDSTPGQGSTFRCIFPFVIKLS